ncbi:MAG: MoaD/ThiS family protein [Anaerolineales bacterium]|nr:MoaD/ThiS family protein [Anaerolineales bacterium]MDW8160960.1 MoaD/ThiS family protein [Anaerolineales bacterium]
MNELEVTFQLHTVLQIQTPSGTVTSLRHRMRAGETLKEALAALGLSVDPDETLIVVNRRNVDLDYRPKAGDIIHLIPAIAGG